MSLAVLTCVLAAAPTVDARFVMEVSGIPVAQIHVRVEGERYQYESTHFFEETQVKSLELSMRDGPFEVLSLLRKPKPGCRSVKEEKSGRSETLCDATLDGVPFTASYANNGELETFRIEHVEWKRVHGNQPRPTENPFARGVEVQENANAFEPALPGARWLKSAPRGIGSADQRERCLVLARDALIDHPDRRLMLGLVLEDGRAFPHAWVRENGIDLDPSLTEADPSRTYVELPAERRGLIFLELFDGRRRLVHR